MKKVFVRVFFLSLGFLILTSFVSAQTLPPVDQFMRSFIQGVEDVFGPLFEALLGTDQFSDFFFAKILLFLLLFFVIFSVAGRVHFLRENKGISFIVALVISLLAVRFISEETFIGGILLPYGTLGIAITSFLPFLIYFWFVHQSAVGGFGRRIAWALYAIIFVAVWATRPAGEISSTSNWIYFLGFVAVGISLFFDKQIHRYFRTHELSSWRNRATNRAVAGLQSEYLNILNVDSNEARARRAEIERELRRHGAELP